MISTRGPLSIPMTPADSRRESTSLRFLLEETLLNVRARMRCGGASRARVHDAWVGPLPAFYIYSMDSHRCSRGGVDCRSPSSSWTTRSCSYAHSPTH